MAYLYLNFLDNLDKGLGDKAWGRNDFFTQSLNEQYETMKRKLGGYAPPLFKNLSDTRFRLRLKNITMYHCRRLTEQWTKISVGIRFCVIS